MESFHSSRLVSLTWLVSIWIAHLHSISPYLIMSQNSSPSTGGYGDVVDYVKEEVNESVESQVESAKQSPSTVLSSETPTQQYLEQLMKDKEELKCLNGPHFKHLTRLIDIEISRVLSSLASSLSDVSHMEGGEKITLTEKIYVPVDKYPRYNFVGRILGPRGMTAKQLEEETGCKIMVRGRGASRQEPLHVLIMCEDYEHRAHLKMKDACEKVNTLLHPPPEGKDELKRKQLIELSIINGTYRPTSATKLALQTPRPGMVAGLPDLLPPRSDSRSALESILEKNVYKGGKQQYNRSQQDEEMDAYSKLFPSLFSNPLASLINNPALQTNEVYKQLLAISFADPALFSLLLSSPPTPSSDGYGGYMQNNNGNNNNKTPFHNAQQTQYPAAIPQANLQQYLQAAAMLNAMPFSHDGSGDGPKQKR